MISLQLAADGGDLSPCPASVTHWASQFVTGARAKSLHLAAASYIYIYYALKRSGRWLRYMPR